MLFDSVELFDQKECKSRGWLEITELIASSHDHV